MGFWDFFKRKPESVENKKISLSNLESWLGDKAVTVEEQKKVFLDSIRARIYKLIKDLKERIAALEEVDLEQIKADDRIKLVVNENLKNYLVYLEKLIDRLTDINERPGEDVIERINFIFSDFKKKSALTYEKVTLLIGKEMGAIKENISQFFVDIESVLKGNKSLIEESKIIKLIEIKVKEYGEIKKNLGEYEKNIEGLKGNIKAKQEEIESIKSSDKFTEEKKKEQELETKESELNGCMFELNKMIDFKGLASFYHSFEKEMEMVKAHKENFKQAFQKTNGGDIAYLLRDSKLQNVDILNKIQEIEDKKKELKSLEETERGKLSGQVKKLNSEIGVFNSEKSVKEKKLNKSEENLKGVVELMKSELGKIGVDVE